jgi:hypothetical protein
MSLSEKAERIKMHGETVKKRKKNFVYGNPQIN